MAAITDPDYIPPIEMTFNEGKPITSGQGLQLAGNPIAIVQGKVGAPYVRTVLHPYNGGFVGDGGDGVLYDYDRDGSVTEVLTGQLDSDSSYVYKATGLSHGGEVVSSFFIKGSLDGSSWFTVFVTADTYTPSDIYNSTPQYVGGDLLFGCPATSTIQDHTLSFNFLKFSWGGSPFDRGVIELYKKKHY